MKWALVGVLLVALLAAVASGLGGPNAEEASKAFPRQPELATAILRGDQEAITAQLAAGAQLDQLNDEGRTLLHWAVMHAELGAVRTLLAAGADPAIGDQNGLTPMHWAAKYERPNLLEAFIKAGADPNIGNTITQAPVIYEALMTRRPENITLLLDAGAYLNRADRSGEAPLHTAAAINDFSSVLLLLERGADPLAHNKLGVSFQAYLYRTDEKLLNVSARKTLQRIRTWLHEHQVPVEG